MTLAHRGTALFGAVAACCILAAPVGAAELSDADREAGRVLFSSDTTPACALCHTLKDAAAEGAIGPSLDALKPDATRVATVLRTGLGVMPSYEALSDEQIALLSRYVAGVAAGQ